MKYDWWCDVGVGDLWFWIMEQKDLRSKEDITMVVKPANAGK